MSSSDPQESWTLMATGDSYVRKSTGHAFVVRRVFLGSGVKEDAYGFYPAPDGSYSMVGPGLHSEFGQTTLPFAFVTRTLTLVVDENQSSAIWLAIQDFAKDSRSLPYNVLNRNCIDLVDSIVRAVGLHSPKREVFQTPDAYMASVIELNRDDQ
jgi:hypothetical protein